MTKLKNVKSTYTVLALLLYDLEAWRMTERDASRMDIDPGVGA